MPETIYDKKLDKILIPTDKWVELLSSIHGSTHRDKTQMSDLIDHLNINIPKSAAELFVTRYCLDCKFNFNLKFQLKHIYK